MGKRRRRGPGGGVVGPEARACERASPDPIWIGGKEGNDVGEEWWVRVSGPWGVGARGGPAHSGGWGQLGHWPGRGPVGHEALFLYFSFIFAF